MSASLPIRVVLAGIALCVAPAISRAQAPQTRACKDGTISSHSHFACWGHGGVDTTRAVEGGRATSSKHRPMEPIQAGAPRSKHAKAATRSESKASVHHERAEHHDRHALEKQRKNAHRKWWPWGHKKAKPKDARDKKRDNAARLPVPEQPRRR